MRWYQTAIIKGVAMPAMRKGDTSQKRWQNLILPLLPKGEGRIFTELGCNAGFYLREAEKLGFVAQGIEKELEFIKQAEYWDEQEPSTVKIIEGDINDYTVPCSSVVLLANVHYWLKPEDVDRLIKKLRNSLYIIVVGRFQHHPEMLSPCDPEVIKEKMGKPLKTLKTRKHYSMLFKNDLEEHNTEDLVQYIKQTHYFYPAFIDFLNGKPELYMKYLRRRLSRKDQTYLKKHTELFNSIKENGICEPLLYDGKCILNGNHRLIIAHYLQIKKVLCRQLTL